MQRSKKMAELLTRCKEEGTEIPALTFPGMYPLIYITADCGILCPQCVRDNMNLINDIDDPQWYIEDYDTYMEGSPINCDHCNEEIESAYGDPDNPDD